MKTTTCAFMASCLVLVMGTTCWAAEMTDKALTDNNGQQVASGTTTENKEELRAWLGSIKPAAGGQEAKPERQGGGTEYWQQTVRRENRGHLQE